MRRGVVFANVNRASPIVLTYWQLADLALMTGRDVAAEVQALAAERFEVKTLGQLMRALSQRLMLGVNIPAHHLAAPRPAPIAFPVSAGVHGADCAPPDAEPVSRESQSAETSSTPMGDA